MLEAAPIHDQQPSYSPGIKRALRAGGGGERACSSCQHIHSNPLTGKCFQCLHAGGTYPNWREKQCRR